MSFYAPHTLRLLLITPHPEDIAYIQAAAQQVNYLSTKNGKPLSVKIIPINPTGIESLRLHYTRATPDMVLCDYDAQCPKGERHPECSNGNAVLNALGVTTDIPAFCYSDRYDGHVNFENIESVILGAPNAQMGIRQLVTPTLPSRRDPSETAPSQAPTLNPDLLSYMQRMAAQRAEAQKGAPARP